MSFHLDLAGDGSLQHRLARALEAAIRSGRLRAGSRLPTSRELAQQLGIARNTVTLALDELVARGLAEPRARRGVFVNPLPTAVRSESAAAVPAAAPLSKRAQVLLAAGAIGPAANVRHALEYGQPLVSPTLLHGWRQALSRAAERMPLQYPDPAGVAALREGIASMLSTRRGLRVVADDVIVVSGAQQAFDLIATVLVDPGDRVVLEDPHYDGARLAFAAAGAQLVPCAVDDQGLQVAHLPVGGARLAYVTPSHQFPTGALLSNARRQALLQWAAQHAAWIVEDDYDGEFRYGTAPAAALHALDGGRRVIYVGTFSKMLFPALRLGYLVAPPALRAAFAAAKRSADRGSATIEQYAVADLLASGAVDRHLRRLIRELERRRRTLAAALQKHGGRRIALEGINAGMHVVARISRMPWTQWDALVRCAHERGLRLEAVRPHLLPLSGDIGVLLGYAASPPAALTDAAQRLCAAVEAVDAGGR